MFKSYWFIGFCPVVGHTVQVKARTMKTLDSEPENWKLILVIGKMAVYLRTRIIYENKR